MQNNWEEIASQWKQFAGDAKKEWGQLTNDELLLINGDRELLASILQKKYSLAKGEANKQIYMWAAKQKV